MKKLRISILCALFLFSAGSANLCAQTQNEGENYYSNPKKGIKPAIPKAYLDTSIVNKTDNLTVELVGLTNDTTPKKDTTSLKLKSLRQYSSYENPYYWGPSIYYSWDPWYSPYWNSWYYPGWGGSHWHLTYSWGCGPYWNYGFGWSWGYGSPWWYWDPFYYPYYAHYGYYGYYLGGYAYHHGRNGYGDFGHGYLGSGGRGAAVGIPSRGNNPAPSPAQVGRGTVRRGGVDLNNGGRAPRGSISGTGSVGRGTNATASHTNTTGRTLANNGRYAKPESVNTQRNMNTTRNSRDNSSMRSGMTNSRSSYSTPARSSRFESGRTESRSSSFNSNSSSSRSTSGSFRSSSPSRSSGFSGGSSSRSSGGFSGSGSSSRGGGGRR